MSQLSYYLAQNRFCVLLEHLTSIAEIVPIQPTLAGYPVCITLADRVQSDHDIAVIDRAADYAAAIDKVLHYAGKDRDISDFEHFLVQAKQQQYQNLLLLTGDKLKQHHDGDDLHPRTRYLESVNAVMAAKAYDYFYIGVAFNPFKYTQAEQDAQYFKLHKKIKAGADFIITQLGYDMAALIQLQQFLKQQNYSLKLLACVMPLTLPRAQFMLKNKTAGIVLTPHMLNVLQQEQQAGLGDRVYRRCALQILMCQHLGFAGVHLSACHQAKEQHLLADYIEQYRHLDFTACQRLWNELWEITSDEALRPHIDHDMPLVTSQQIAKYQYLQIMHDMFFNSKVARSMGHFIFNPSFWQKHLAQKMLLKTEQLSKQGILGCESCGQCRIAETLYICPETCPKGLANGPCGGTYLDRCEFGDRQCIHSVKASLAKAVQQTEVLENTLIPTVPIAIRGTSSWQNWYVKS
ncbi:MULTISPECIES: methylenetetrahydrofolate reductase C-terminal domain-containing protein [unclassified Acinetobacter]|uniref:methylenetetrahydrofolate reductase C-terminal domain-containing protein n=1 Tax=unclassified Acinetobacter TaxID=196816 RepID=UPI0029341A0D|nr:MULTISPECIES: methylenetetrahydrofolate reductase C-terminal domain-containing protein [unclassified Acinetobacter]WOE31297.1 methylenetetrahydrofolate reductase C-terminal domain-containing protein [Acinetobacter sp. SAAs470]WOE39493.1 methylenetetrahydrofolate reductase C-terminal domain-containing protein [Acinetobacter sp. SAAs474]